MSVGRGGPLVRYRYGWQVRVDRLVDELAAIDPTADLVMIEPTTLGPKGQWRNASAAGKELIMAALEDLARTCGRCGRVEAERLEYCDDCKQKLAAHEGDR